MSNWIPESTSENEEMYKIGSPYPQKMICKHFKINDKGEKRLVEEKTFKLVEEKDFDKINENKHSDGNIDFKD